MLSKKRTTKVLIRLSGYAPLLFAHDKTRLNYDENLDSVTYTKETNGVAHNETSAESWETILT